MFNDYNKTFSGNTKIGGYFPRMLPVATGLLSVHTKCFINIE